MATSFITRDGKHGFWIQDHLMQVVCWGILIGFDKNPEYKQNFDQEFLETIYSNSQGFFIGFMHLRLEDFVYSEERERDFLFILTQAKSFFSSRGDYLSIGELNSFQVHSDTRREWVKPLETRKVIGVLDVLIKIIKKEFWDEELYLE